MNVGVEFIIVFIQGTSDLRPLLRRDTIYCGQGLEVVSMLEALRLLISTGSVGHSHFVKSPLRFHERRCHADSLERVHR